MQSEMDGSRVTDSLKQYIAKLEVENDKIRAENVEPKARIVKLEDKQSQNELVKNLLSVLQKIWSCINTGKSDWCYKL